jgi:hypothetical protein
VLWISKRWIKRLGIGFVMLFGVALVVNGTLAWWTRHRLNRKIAELRAAGEPASLADLTPKRLPPEENAAAYLQQIVLKLDRFEKDYGNFYGTPLGRQLDENERKDLPPNAEQIAAMRTILDADRTILPTVKKAGACNTYASLLDFKAPSAQFLESSIKTLEIWRLNHYAAWQIAVLADDGSSDEAVRLGTRILRLARLYDNEPGFAPHIESLSVRGIAFDAINRAVRQNQVAPNVRAELDAELALHDKLAPLQSALRSERAWALSRMTEQAGGILDFVRWPTLNRMLGDSDLEDQACEIARLPMEQIRPRWDPVAKHAVPPQFSGTKGPGMEAALINEFDADFSHITMARCLRVVNALGEYRLRTGNEPERIEQLSLPHEAIIDPWSGKPLLLKKISTGWIVYSVWRNGVDDGGRFDVENGDWGFGPPGWHSDANDPGLPRRGVNGHIPRRF